MYVCCERCATSGDEWTKHYERKHTPACNVNQFPDMPEAQYLDDPMAEIKILERMTKALALTQMLHQEMRDLDRCGKYFIPNWPKFLELTISLLCIVLSYVEHALRALTTSDPKIEENSLMALHSNDEQDGRKA